MSEGGDLYFEAFVETVERLHRASWQASDGLTRLLEQYENIQFYRKLKTGLLGELEGGDVKFVDDVKDSSASVEVVGKDGSSILFPRHELQNSSGTLLDTILQSDRTATKVDVSLNRTELELLEPYLRGNMDQVDPLPAYEASLGKVFDYMNIPKRDVAEMEVKLAFALLKKAAKSFFPNRACQLIKKISGLSTTVEKIIEENAGEINAAQFCEKDGKVLGQLLPGMKECKKISIDKSSSSCSDYDCPTRHHEFKFARLDFVNSYRKSEANVSFHLSLDSWKCTSFERGFLLFTCKDTAPAGLVIRADLLAWIGKRELLAESKSLEQMREIEHIWKKICYPSRHVELRFEDLFTSGSLSELRKCLEIPLSIPDERIWLWAIGLVRWYVLTPFYIHMKKTSR